MSPELITKALEEIDSNLILHWQVIIQESILHIYINRNVDRELDYTQIINDVSETLSNLASNLANNVDDVWQGYWLYCRILGELEPDWQTFIDLTDNLTDNLIQNTEELVTDIQESIEELKEFTKDNNERESANNSLTLETLTEAENLQETSQNNLIEEQERQENSVTLELEEIAVENLDRTPESIDKDLIQSENQEAESTINLSEYCFIRNRKLLSSELVAPHLKIANLLKSFHELTEIDRKNTASLLNDFFKLEKNIELENQPLEIKIWWEQLNELSDEEKRKAAIWLSRYCSDRDTTLAQIQSVFEFENLKQIASRESLAETPNSPASIQSESREQNHQKNKTETSRNSQIKPQNKPTPSSTRINLLVPISWLLATVILIMLGVNSGNSDSPVQEALIPPICQNLSEPETLNYCQLAVGLVGDELFTETQQKSVILSPIEEVDALDLALLYCDKIVNFRAGTPSNDSDSRDAEMISSHSQNILPGIYIAEAKQHNF
jgi:hypothetical protein